MRRSHLTPLAAAHDPGRYGTKASTLARLHTAGLAVPDGLVLPAGLTDVQVRHSVPEIVAWAGRNTAHGLIARSSAAAEDGTRSSFAGVYASVFTTARPDDVLAGIGGVLASAHAPTTTSYAHARQITADASIAVLIQPALRPYAAGILFADLVACRATLAGN
jgi:pyruvate,water dikinase